MLGNTQVTVLRQLHEAEEGVLIEEVLRNWRHKAVGVKSIAGLESKGFISVSNGVAYFVRFPTELEVSSGSKIFTAEELREFDEMSRRNLVYLYRRELEEIGLGRAKRGYLPDGVRRSLKRLGVIKWKILDLTSQGQALLLELTRGLTPR